MIGRTIKELRAMTDAELKEQGWGFSRRHGRPVVLVLDDGTKLFPSCDPEGNGPGMIFGEDKDGFFIVQAPK